MREAIQSEIQSVANQLAFDRIKHLHSHKAYVYARNIVDTIDLIRLGARASPVCNLTNIQEATVRSLFRQLHGLPSSPGQAGFTVTWYLKNDLRQVHANLIWRLHQALTQTVRRKDRLSIVEHFVRQIAGWFVEYGFCLCLPTELDSRRDGLDTFPQAGHQDEIRGFPAHGRNCRPTNNSRVWVQNSLSRLSKAFFQSLRTA